MTREIPLSSRKYPGLVALVDDEDYERVSAFRWRPEKSSTTGRFYAVTGQQRGGDRIVYLHRFVMNAAPGQQFDHRNRDGLDCQKHNLRACTTSQNAANRGPQRTNASGLKGITYRVQKKRWMAQIWKDGRYHYLGLFDSPDDAGRAYDRAALDMFGEFAFLNFPEGEAA